MTPLTNITLKYSTPSLYIDAINKEEIKWPSKLGDFFPIADAPDAYWTGFFTSKANDKLYFRDASRSFHSASKLFSLAVID